MDKLNLYIAPSLEMLTADWEKADSTSGRRRKSKSIVWLEEGLQIQEQQYVPATLLMPYLTGFHSELVSSSGRRTRNTVSQRLF
jgi:hypothetical protein